MASKLPIDEEYVATLKQLTQERIGWLIESMYGTRYESRIEEFCVFSDSLPHESLQSLAENYPSLVESLRDDAIVEWNWIEDADERHLTCRISFYHQAYTRLMRRFRQYYELRFVKTDDIQSRPEIEETIAQNRLRRAKKRKRGIRRHPIFFWRWVCTD